MKLTEQDIINIYNAAREQMDEAEDMLRSHFREKHQLEIELATSQEDLNAIKEKLRIMPMSVSKTLMFRSILMREDQLC